MSGRFGGNSGRPAWIQWAVCLTAALIMLAGAAAADGYKSAWAIPEGYQVERVFILSRHNIRSPLSDGDSMLGRIVPHEWFKWTSPSGELSVKGGILETAMGQYFRKWTQSVGLFGENEQPDQTAARFYANGYQRTRATARFFASGLLPTADLIVECHAPLNTMDAIFKPQLHFYTEKYKADILAQIAEGGGLAGMDGVHAGLLDSLNLLMDVTDMRDSEAYQAGEYGNLLENDLEIILKEGSSADMKGYLRTATSVADAMIMQYYEEPDDQKAAFGHELTEEEWRMISGIVTKYGEILYGTPLIAVSAAHPMLETIRNELTARGRKFSFYCGHDANLASVIGALGVEEYTLPEAIETRTPVGGKLMLVRMTDENENAWYDVSLVYMSTRQMRNLEIPDDENPPMKFALRLKGVPVNGQGLIAEKDFLKLLEDRIDELTLMKIRYIPETAEEDAA